MRGVRVSVEYVAQSLKDLPDSLKCARNKCLHCGESYSIAETAERAYEKFPDPYGYLRACLTHCLGCWLMYHLGVDNPDGAIAQERSCCGETLFNDFRGHLLPGVQIAVLPLTRVKVMELDAVQLPGPAFVYSDFSISRLNLKVREWNTPVNNLFGEPFESSTALAFPVEVDWLRWVREPLPANHADLIRKLSARADQICLDLLRFGEGDLCTPHSLPGRAGQTRENPMMSAALLVNPATREAQVFGGDSFTHLLTQGLGLELYNSTSPSPPVEGEVGDLARHAIFLYSAAIESLNATSKFVQAMSLLEFLTFPHGYEKMQEVKKVVAGCTATTREQYDFILARFKELTSIKDASGREVGLRTCIVHIGARLEDLLSGAEIRELLCELDGYIRPMIREMLEKSHLDWRSFEERRNERRKSFHS